MGLAVVCSMWKRFLCERRRERVHSRGRGDNGVVDNIKKLKLYFVGGGGRVGG